jgi:hypothetical protein
MLHAWVGRGVEGPMAEDIVYPASLLWRNECILLDSMSECILLDMAEEEEWGASPCAPFLVARVVS